MDIVVNIPDKKAPGFIERQIATIEYALAWKTAQAASDGSPESLAAILDAWRKTVEHLLQFVVEPMDRDEARHALMQASEEEIENILDAIRGKDSKPPLAKSPS